MRFHTIIINGEPEWGVTSRELALFLKRRHKHILRDIRVFLSRKSLSFCVFHFEEKNIPAISLPGAAGVCFNGRGGERVFAPAAGRRLNPAGGYLKALLRLNNPAGG